MAHHAINLPPGGLANMSVLLLPELDQVLDHEGLGGLGEDELHLGVGLAQRVGHASVVRSAPCAHG